MEGKANIKRTDILVASWAQIKFYPFSDINLFIKTNESHDYIKSFTKSATRILNV